MDGWISIHRKLKEHWLWKDPVKLKWWLDILLTVNHKPGKVNIGNQVFECGRGESLRSLQTWADEWRVSKSMVRRFFILLQNENMIRTKSVQKSTHLTVCKYGSYQIERNDYEPKMKRKRNDDETQTAPNNNDNKNNKEIKEKYREAVTLLPSEFSKLESEFGKDKTGWMLDKLDNFKQANGKTYKSDYRAILNWVVVASEKDYKPKVNGSASPVKKTYTKQEVNDLFLK